MPRTYLATLALAGCATVVIGCGGGGSTKSSTSTSAQATPRSSTVSATTTSATTATPIPKGAALTVAQISAKADAICTHLSSQRNLLNVSTPEDLKLAVPQVAAYQRQMLSEFEQLVPPASFANTWQKILANARTLAESTAQVSEKLQANDGAGARPAYAAFAKARLEMRATAKQAGMKSCGIY
jgi:inorganic triphosphatase YgiF